jgi:hypothetical protein
MSKYENKMSDSEDNMSDIDDNDDNNNHGLHRDNNETLTDGA